jgi:hypothetical protein
MYCICQFRRVKVKTYGRNNIFWRGFVHISVNALQYYFERFSTSLKWFSVNWHYIFDCRAKMFAFLCYPSIGFYQSRKSYWSCNNGPIGIKNSFKEPIGSKEGRKLIWHFWQQTPIIIISPISFHLHRLENNKDDNSSHTGSSKFLFRLRTIHFCQLF